MKRLEDRLLDLFIFGGRFDGQVALTNLSQIARGQNALETGFHRFGGDQTARDLTDHVAFDLQQPFLDPIRIEVIEPNIISSQSTDVGNARTHLACADNADRLNLSHYAHTPGRTMTRPRWVPNTKPAL